MVQNMRVSQTRDLQDREPVKYVGAKSSETKRKRHKRRNKQFGWLWLSVKVQWSSLCKFKSQNTLLVASRSLAQLHNAVNCFLACRHSDYGDLENTSLPPTGNTWDVLHRKHVIQNRKHVARPHLYCTCESTTSLVRRRISLHRWKAFPKRDFLRSLVVSVLTGFRLKL